MQISCPTHCLYPNPPLKVEGLADMAPCHSLWASETPSVFYQRCCKDLL